MATRALGKMRRKVTPNSNSSPKSELTFETFQKNMGSLGLPTPIPLLMDDIIYEILSATSAMAKSDMDRRETLSSYALVCQTWGRAAQSILFRHVFLQIRPSMLSLLRIISHNTERGKRLAGYIKSATIKLSRDVEMNDPPTLPMMHPRYVNRQSCCHRLLVRCNLLDL